MNLTKLLVPLFLVSFICNSMSSDYVILLPFTTGKQIWSQNDSLVRGLNDSRVNSLSDLVYYNQNGITPMWHHQTPNVRIGNLDTTAHAATATAWQSLSISDKYSYCAQAQGDLYRVEFEKNSKEIAELSQEELLNKIDELNQKLKELECNYQHELLKASKEVQQQIKQCGEPLAITLSEKKDKLLQELFAEFMMDLKRLKTQIAIVRCAIGQCEIRLQKYVANALKVITDSKPTEYIVQQQIPAIKTEIERLELKAEKSSGKVFIKIMRQVLVNKAQLKYLESVVKQRLERQYTEQRLEDLKELKEYLILMQFDNKQTINAVNKSIIDNSKLIYYNTLRNPEQNLLKELGIPEDCFTKLHGDALQKRAFDIANTVLYTTALQNVQYTNNQHIKAYVDATAQMCYWTVSNAQNGNPHETIVATILTEAFSQATNDVISFYKGTAIGGIESIKSSWDFIWHPTKIATAIKQAVSLNMRIANREPEVILALSHAIDEFLLMPVDKQAEQLGVLFGTLMTPNIVSQVSQVTGFNKALQSFTKLAKIELEALKTLAKVENAVFKNINGVAVPERFVSIIEKLKEMEIITKQEHIIEQLDALGAPFFVSSREAIKSVAKEISIELQVFDIAEMCIKDISPVDFEKYWESLIKDPSHRGKIMMLNMQEAFVGIVCEQRGLLTGPLKRDGIGGAEFIDKLGQKWDVKRAISLSSHGQQIFNPKVLLSKIKRDLLLGENIILDMIKLENKDFQVLFKEVLQKLSESELKRIIGICKAGTMLFQRQS